MKRLLQYLGKSIDFCQRVLPHVVPEELRAVGEKAEHAGAVLDVEHAGAVRRMERPHVDPGSRGRVASDVFHDEEGELRLCERAGRRAGRRAGARGQARARGRAGARGRARAGAGCERGQERRFGRAPHVELRRQRLLAPKVEGGALRIRAQVVEIARFFALIAAHRLPSVVPYQHFKKSGALVDAASH